MRRRCARVDLRAGPAGARHRLRRRRVPAPGRRPRRAPVRARRVRGAARGRSHSACRTRDLRVGDMEALPYEDDTFDLVTGFNSFFFANDIVAALREAGRVAKPGAPVVIQVWGPHERNDLEAMKEIVRPFMPPRPADAPARARLLAARRARGPRRAGRARARERVRHRLGPRSTPTRTRSGARWWPPPGSRCWSAPIRRRRSRTRSSQGSAAHRSQDGGYRLQNEYHYLIARA